MATMQILCCCFAVHYLNIDSIAFNIGGNFFRVARVDILSKTDDVIGFTKLEKLFGCACWRSIEPENVIATA